MKRMKKATAQFLCGFLCLVSLTGCGENTAGSVNNNNNNNGIIIVANSPDEAGASSGDRTPLEEASDFSFDFETLEYSFTGVENGEFYYIRVYPVVDGEEGNSASFQSDKIDANDDNSYSGIIEGQTLLAGDYVAHVVASAAGYASSDIEISGTSTLLASAEVSANWNTGDGENPDVTADITITAGDNITVSFTLVITNEAGQEVYRDDNAGTGTINLTAADLGTEALSIEDVYNVTVTVNELVGYTIPAEGVTSRITERQVWGPPM